MELAQMKLANPRRFAMANAIRVLALDAVKAANSGHSGMPMGMADVATVLYDAHLRFDPKTPDWPDRDRLVLSAGHGSMLLYGLLYLTGTEAMTLEQVKNFRQLGAATAGHPEFGHAPGIEMTTGPLGQGLATAVGMAIAEEHLRARFGPKIVNHKTWVIAGDGCLMEGISQEAVALAGRQELSNLIVLWDDNGISIDGQVALADRTDQCARFEASGWVTRAVNGHDTAEIEAAMDWAIRQTAPTLLACKTHIGFGAPTQQDTHSAHGAITGDEEIAGARAAYGWPHSPFEIPSEIKADWEATGARGARSRAEWESAFAELSERQRTEFTRSMSGEPPKRLAPAIRAVKKTAIESAAESPPKIATRAASQKVLEAVNGVHPDTMGGSADLTGSNNTLTTDMGVFQPDNRKGRYIHYGIREHGMAAAMNGLALHGGVQPYGGTFMVFADYARAAMRLSALMGLRTIHVMTHDSIGVGEDGPTHQPVEHLAMLRATPNLTVFRPADAAETAEAWEAALTSEGPSVLSLTRQGVPAVRTKYSAKNLSAHGAYILAESGHKRRAILIATGSEVAVALMARELLEAEGIGTRVVSMPSMELFAQQEDRYRRKILPPGPIRVGIEAAARMGWDRWLSGERGNWRKAAFVGMEGFGASAPADTLFQHFGITAEAAAEKVKELL